MLNAAKIEPPKQLTCDEVAEFFLALANETGESITNLKLQKLVYYAQAWYLANNRSPLFSEDFQAWVHGPVIPTLYHKFKSFGFSPITSSLKLAEIKKKFSPDAVSFLEEVAKIYMPESGYKLELMTHSESPWIDARAGIAPDELCSNTISKKTMLQFYGQKIN